MAYRRSNAIHSALAMSSSTRDAAVIWARSSATDADLRRGFFAALRESGYQGSVAYEMCSPLRGGGSEANLDRCARRFLEYMQQI